MADDAPVDAGTEGSTRDVPHRSTEERCDMTSEHVSADSVPAAAPDNTTSVLPAASAPRGPTSNGSGAVVEPPAGAVDPSAPTERIDLAATRAEKGDTQEQPVAELPAARPRWRGIGRRRKAPRKGSFWRELPVLLAIALALTMLIKTFLIQAFFIPSGSMEKTLHGCPGCSGDRVLVNKLVYQFRDPRPGEIVVFRAPDSWESEVQVADSGNAVQRGLRWVGQTVGLVQSDEKDVIKRVIAVGGQTVRCCDNGRIVVDDVPLDEDYIFYADAANAQRPFSATVPEGRLWVMGDHRDNSADSRAHMQDANNGTISVDDVIGKAFVIAWPPSRWDALGTPDTFDAVASGPVAMGAPFALGLLGVVPIAGVRRWRRRRRRP